MEGLDNDARRSFLNDNVLYWSTVHDLIVPSGWKEVALRWKNSKAKFLFRERIFLFRDRTVVKTERSEVLAVQIEEKKNSLEEKKSLRVFTSKRTDFPAARILFLC